MGVNEDCLAHSASQVLWAFSDTKIMQTEGAGHATRPDTRRGDNLADSREFVLPLQILEFCLVETFPVRDSLPTET